MAPATKTRYSARRPMGYGDLQLDRGQVFDLRGMLNDEKLIRLGYCQEVDPKRELHRCAECGADFIDIGARTAHGNERHRPQTLTPHDENARQERQERLLNELAPLNVGTEPAHIGGR